MAMIRFLRDSLRARQDAASSLQSIAESLHGAFTGAQGTEALSERVGSLETTLAKQLAEAQGAYARAEQKFKAARSSEERERRLADARSEPQAVDVDEFDFDAAADALATGDIPVPDAWGGDGQGVHTMPSGLEARDTRLAAPLAMKWGPISGVSG